MKGHTTEACHTLKDKVQDLINNKVISLKDPKPGIPDNLSSSH